MGLIGSEKKLGLKHFIRMAGSLILGSVIIITDILPVYAMSDQPLIISENEVINTEMIPEQTVDMKESDETPDINIETEGEAEYETVTSDNILQEGGFTEEKDTFSKEDELSNDGIVCDAYKKVADYIAAEALKWDGTSETISIDISDYGISIDNNEELINAAINGHPELFFLSGTYSYSCNSAGIITNALFYVDKEYKKSDITAFNNAVDNILSGIDDCWTDLQKIIYIHDYLVMNINYDESLVKHDAYNALIEGDCVCQGYSLAFMY
ncbi:MAG: hypothetical protein K6E98_10090, partial [Lachnospiraceae bacterium]|nr:hypothetical protein [Lachnospiraceae bacterium]